MKARKIISFISFFLLPITLNYFSPVLIVQAGFEKTFSVMHIIYGLMIFIAMIFGAAWCSYICPFGALQELLPDQGGKSKLLKTNFLNLKYVTGTLWLLLIFAPIFRYGFQKTSIFYHMEDTKVTIDSMHGLILYYIITCAIIIISALLGKRVWCRYLCPMYIFNYIGIRISKLLRLPYIKMSADTNKCTQCHKCADSCPMGLDILTMMNNGTWNRYECIQCGECIHSCKSNVIKRSLSKFN
jgi:polyferredoxin